MSTRRIAAALSLLGVLAMGTHTDFVQAATPLAPGAWAGDQLQLVIDAKGGHIETGCAGGRVAGPIILSADGSFTATGSLHDHQGGPQHADVPAQAATVTRFSGQVQDGKMRLEVLRAGAAAPEVYQLRLGARIKLIRCL